jgi:hypothetical protein
MTELMVFAMMQWGIFTAAIARSKQRNVAAWFAVGAVLPVIGIAILIAMPAQPRRAIRPARLRALPT